MLLVKGLAYVWWLVRGFPVVIGKSLALRHDAYDTRSYEGSVAKLLFRGGGAPRKERTDGRTCLVMRVLSQSCFSEGFGICKPLNFREPIF
jgi:hypothetical protein